MTLKLGGSACVLESLFVIPVMLPTIYFVDLHIKQYADVIGKGHREFMYNCSSSKAVMDSHRKRFISRKVIINHRRSLSSQFLYIIIFFGFLFFVISYVFFVLFFL